MKKVFGKKVTVVRMEIEVKLEDMVTMAFSREAFYQKCLDATWEDLHDVDGNAVGRVRVKMVNGKKVGK